VGQVAPRALTVLQPGTVQMHLSMAGAWTATMLQRLEAARLATPRLQPDTFQAFGDAMATVLAFYLALSHTLEVTRRAPWLDSVPMDPDALGELHRKAERFRDMFMHFSDKDEREIDWGPIPWSPGPYDGRRPKIRMATSSGLGFEDGQAWLYAPPDQHSTTRESTRLSWSSMEQASRAIEVWTLDLLNRWAEVQKRWAPYVEAHGHQLRTHLDS
jgi:hypothetical protein